MTNERGLLAETTDRFARKFLPEAPQPHELWMLCGKILRSLSDLTWLGPAADPLLHRLAAIGGTAWAGYRFVTTSPRFAITTIEVKGNHVLTADQIRAAVPVTMGDNLFEANLDAIAE